MNKVIGFIVLLGMIIPSYSQDSSDAIRMKKMRYMESRLAKEIDCDQTEGSNYETRICLNLKFQELDSVMNSKFVRFLSRTQGDSAQTRLKEYQLIWVKNRRLQSEIVSDGYRGHMLGIAYLQCMIASTKSRISELDALIGDF